MSVATDARGRMYVLDQVNGRVLRRGADGTAEVTLPMKLSGAQDLAIGSDGSVAVLDRLGDKTVAIYDASGRLRGDLSLAGGGVGDPGLLTGVFVDGSDVYVEREHGTLIRIGDTSGVVGAPAEVPGRPSRDGSTWLHAGIIDKASGRAYVSAVDRTTGEHLYTRELRQRAELRSIVLLDSDRSGLVYFATELHEEPGHDWVAVTCLEPRHGEPVGAAVLPASTMPEETFRDLTVLDAGGVLYAHRTEGGVSYEVYECH